MEQSSATAGAGVVVFGMHRSGTSALMQCLVSLGLTAGEPGDLIGANEGNPHGHHELEAIVQLNDRLLASLGHRWDAPPMDQEELSGPGFEWFRREARQVLDEKLPPSNWVLKDPRFCVLWRAYRDVFEHRPLSVLIVRHPVEVAESLQRRDLLPLAHGLALWDAHNRFVLSSLDADDVIVPVSHAQLVADPRTVTDALAERLAAEGFDVARSAAAESVIDESLVRPSGAEPVSGSTGEIYRAIEHWIDGGPRPDIDAHPGVDVAGPLRRAADRMMRCTPPDDAAAVEPAMPDDHAGSETFDRWLADARAGRPAALMEWQVEDLAPLVELLRAQRGWWLCTSTAADRSADDAERDAARLRLTDAVERGLGPGTLGHLDRVADLAGIWSSGVGARLVASASRPPSPGYAVIRTPPRIHMLPGPDRWWVDLVGEVFFPRGLPNESNVLDRALVSGRFAELIDRVRSDGGLVVGPGLLEGLASAWNAPGLLHVPVAARTAVEHCEELLDLVSALVDEQAPATVLVGPTPITPMIMTRLTEQNPATPALAIGDVGDLWIEPRRPTHPLWRANRPELEAVDAYGFLSR